MPACPKPLSGIHIAKCPLSDMRLHSTCLKSASSLTVVLPLQAQNISAPLVRGTSCVTQPTRGLFEDLWFAGFKIDAPQLITSASTTIQAALRGHLCRQRLQGLREAAVKIQACWRAWVCHRNYLLMRTVAAPVQPGFKGRWSHQDWLQLQLDVRKFHQQSTAAALIQAAFRSKTTRQRFLVMKATKIQAAVRRYLGSKRRMWRAELALFRQQWPQRLHKCNAVDKIEAAWKTYKARQCFLVMKAAATKIQAAVRRYLVSERRLRWRAELALFRQRRRPRRLRKYKAVDKIEAAWLGYKAHQRFQLMKKAALKLQAAYRCHLQRQRFVCLKAAAVKIQTAVRGHRSRQQFLNCKKASIVVQRLYRLWLCRRLRRSATAAVTALQASSNRFLCKHAACTQLLHLKYTVHCHGGAHQH